MGAKFAEAIYCFALLSVIIAVKVSASASESICKDTGDEIKLRQIENNCQSFMVCVRNVGKKMTCPEDSFFDPDKQACVDDDVCYEPCHPACENGKGRFVVEDDCNRYVDCIDECSGREQSCPAGLHFNPILEECDIPNHAECLAELCSHVPEERFEIIGSVNDCRLYYICLATDVLVQQCVKGTAFDPNTGGCQIKDPDDDCERERVPNPPKSVLKQCTEDTELKYIIHPNYNWIYYRCLNSRLTGYECPSGLIFDIQRQQCNLPENIEDPTTVAPN